MAEVTRKTNEWRSYKPSNAGTGAASKIQVKVIDNGPKGRDVQSFWVAAKQTGVDENKNASFAWDQKVAPDKNVVLKMGENDIGEILSVINRQKDKAELYHQNESGNTTFRLERLTGDKGVYFRVRLAKKTASGLVEVSHGLTTGEIEILRVLLADIIRLDYGWQTA